MGLDNLQRSLAKFNMQQELPSLLQRLADAWVKNVKDRITTQDGGKWKSASKWIYAKKGTQKALQGAERYVVSKVTRTGIQIGSDAPGFTLDQHDKGFRNKLIGPNDRIEGRAVILRLARASALGLPSGKSEFHFVPQKPGQTPARKIWPTQEEAEAIGMPIASRWLKEALTRAGVT